MKNLLFIFLLFMAYGNGISQSNDEKLIAMCCEEGRGCTGSAYCTACKNCSGCRHCAKNGGTCGVCSGGRSSRSTSKPNTYTHPKISDKLSEGKYLYVAVPSLNVRSGPGSNYKTIERVKKDSKLAYLDKDGAWIKVKVEGSGLTGYVYYKYLY